MSKTTIDGHYNYEEVISEMEVQQPVSKSWLKNLIILLISLIIFFRLGLLKAGLNDLLMIVFVLFIHEVGHFIGMQLFGYKNVQMFFMPLLGAAVSGESRDVPIYKKALVTLFGPIPGIFIGIILLVVHVKTYTPIYCQFARMLLLINGFNLLPFFPLDGGRFLQHVLFSRNKYVEFLSGLIAALALVVAGYLLGTWLLVLLGLTSFLPIRSSFKIATITEEIKEHILNNNEANSEIIPDGITKEIIDKIYQRMSSHMSVKAVATLVRRVWERVRIKPLGIFSTSGFLGVYSLCICISLLSLATVAITSLSEQNTIFETRLVEYQKSDGKMTLKKQFYVAGRLKTENEVDADRFLYHGETIKYYYDGTIARKGTWLDGKKDSEWKYYDKQGNLFRIRVFDRGKFIVCKEKKGNQWIEKKLEELPVSEQERRLKEAERPPLGPKR